MPGRFPPTVPGSVVGRFTSPRPGRPGLLPPANPLRRLAIILLALLALIGAAWWAVGGNDVALPDQPLPDLAKMLPRPGPQSLLG